MFGQYNNNYETIVPIEDDRDGECPPRRPRAPRLVTLEEIEPDLSAGICCRPLTIIR